MIIHADDYGITVEQARAMLALSDECGGSGPLSSASIFANSPAFPEAAALVRPFVAEAGRSLQDGASDDRRAFSLGLHLNLVEGPSCADPADVPLLVDGRGMLRNDFTRLLALSLGPKRAQLRRQVERECRAQLAVFLDAFPQMRECLHIDSHQHTHAIPLVFDALMDAVRASGARLARLRLPDEPLGPHRLCGTLASAGAANRLKAAVLHALCRHARGRVPQGCAVPLFCGVVLSGKMAAMTAPLARAFESEAVRKAGAGAACKPGEAAAGQGCLNAQAEILFHPVAVPLESCLDPENLPFAQACASPERDAEAQAIVRLGKELGGNPAA